WACAVMRRASPRAWPELRVRAVQKQPLQHGRTRVLDEHARTRPIGALTGRRAEEDRIVGPAAGVHEPGARAASRARAPAIPLALVIPGQWARAVRVAEHHVGIAEIQAR